jgi:hypothetical protein
MIDLGTEIGVLKQQNAELLAALEAYLNVPVLPDPGHEDQLKNAINQSLAAIAKAKGE